MIVKEVRSNLKSGRNDLNVFGLDRKGIVRVKETCPGKDGRYSI